MIAPRRTSVDPELATIEVSDELDRLARTEGTSAAPPPTDPNRTVRSPDGRVAVASIPRPRQRDVVQVAIDGRVVAVDVLDVSASAKRAALLEQLPADTPEPLREATRSALIDLANRLAVAPPPEPHDRRRRDIVRQVQPWPDPVDPVDVLADVHARLVRHVHLSAPAADAVTGWVALTYALEALPHCPALWVYSPTRGCGKSTLLDFVTLLAARALKAESASLAALFRIAETARATLVLDEVDQWLLGDRQREMAGFLNASFARGGTFLRTVGDDHEPAAFDVFSFRAVGGIGRVLDATTRSRCYRVPMERAAVDALPTPMQPSLAEAWADPLRQRLARAVSDLLDPLRARLEDPHGTDYPSALDGRARDLWRPLLALGTVVGGPWASRFAEACVVLTASDADDLRDDGEALLADVRRYFEDHDGRPVRPADLVQWLVELDGGQWADWRGGRPISAKAVAAKLEGFGIRSEQRRADGVKGRWYAPGQFAAAFARYLPPPTPVELIHPGHPGRTAGAEGGEAVGVPDVPDGSDPRPCSRPEMLAPTGWHLLPRRDGSELAVPDPSIPGGRQVRWRDGRAPLELGADDPDAAPDALALFADAIDRVEVTGT